jgi:hypothetical protein
LYQERYHGTLQKGDEILLRCTPNDMVSVISSSSLVTTSTYVYSLFFY